jgi:two-component system, OmpR family, heavy metal sensor histidine kinase CusS
MKRLTFRVRIALLSVLISGAVLVAFGATSWFLMYRERLAALDREIRALAYRHPGWMGGRANFERLSSVIEMVFGEERKEQLILLAKDADGKTRYISAHWPKDLNPETLDLRLEDTPNAIRSTGESPGVANSTSERGAVPRNGPPWMADSEAGRAPGLGYGRLRGGTSAPFIFSKTPRFYTVKTAQSAWRIGILGNDGDRLVLGLNLVDFQAELRQLRNAFLIALPLALLVIGWGGWWIAGRALRPLRSITQVAQHVTMRGLDQRIPRSDEDPEITQLVCVLNGMMDRLEVSFHQATRFSADASHELKTPLTVMQGELENALQSAAPGSAEQQVFANLLEEIQRLKTITRSLLFLAQADAGQLPLKLEPINLSAALIGLTEDMEALAAELNINLALNVASDLQVQADWSLLRQAVLNLLQNALRYNEPDGWINVALAARSGHVELEVCNGGPGIPPADQPRLFERFFRADAAHSRHVDGVGLGLSLAREIVRAHQGTLVLRESRPGRTCFSLSLPGKLQ